MPGSTDGAHKGNERVTTPNRRRLLLLGLPLTIVGMVVVVLGLRGTDAATTELESGALTRSLMVMFAGAVMFALGFMMWLVALVRPLFEKRPADDAV